MRAGRRPGVLPSSSRAVDVGARLPNTTHGPERGYALVEVVVAMLIVGSMSAMCMPLFLTGRMSEGRAERRAAAADAMERVAEELKVYVTADRSLAQGPGVGADGWSLPGGGSGMWALQAGVHRLDPAVWAGSLASFSGQISYTVAVRATDTGPQPDVTFQIVWTEP